MNLARTRKLIVPFEYERRVNWVLQKSCIAIPASAVSFSRGGLCTILQSRAMRGQREEIELRNPTLSVWFTQMLILPRGKVPAPGLTRASVVVKSSVCRCTIEPFLSYVIFLKANLGARHLGIQDSVTGHFGWSDAQPRRQYVVKPPVTLLPSPCTICVHS